MCVWMIDGNHGQNWTHLGRRRRNIALIRRFMAIYNIVHIRTYTCNVLAGNTQASTRRRRQRHTL